MSCNMAVRSKPLKINPYLFVVSSHKNNSLKLFLSKLPHEYKNVREVNENCSLHLTCVLGKPIWSIPLPEQSKTCVCIKDVQNDQTQLKIYFSATCLQGLASPMKSEMYIYGAQLRQTTTSANEDNVFSLHADDTSAHLCCVFVSQWLYRSVLKNKPYTLVTDLPLRTSKPCACNCGVVRTEKKLSTSVGNIAVFQPLKYQLSNSSNQHLSSLLTSHVVTNDDGCCNQALQSTEADTRIDTYTMPGTIYGFTKICDVVPGQVASIAGVVKYFKPICRTKGTDYYVSFRLIDPSKTRGITAIIFHKKESGLPQIQRVGEIVVFTKVLIKSFKGAPQVIYKYYSSFYVFDSDLSEPLRPKSTSPNAFLSQSITNIVCLLQTWACGAGNVSCQHRLCKLEDVIPGVHFDLICQVVSVASSVEEKCVFLSICDGTKLFIKCKHQTVSNGEKKTDALLAEEYRSCVYDIVVYGAVICSHMSIIQPGQFIYLHNVHVNPTHYSDDNEVVIELCLHQKAKQLRAPCFSLLPETNPNIQVLMKRLKELSAWNLRNESITSHRHTKHSFTTIATISASNKVPNKYRCIVKAVAVDINTVEDSVVLVCSVCYSEYPLPKTHEQLVTGGFVLPGSDCTQCKQNGKISAINYTYAIPLIVQDETGSLTVYIADSEFFPRLPPTNLYLDRCSREKILQHLTNLLGKNAFTETSVDVQQRAPRIDCCIFSYYAGKSPQCPQQNKIAKVMYRMFDTVLNYT